MGEGIALVPKKVADRILKWDFVEMGELLPEFGLSASNEQSSSSLTRGDRDLHMENVFCYICGHPQPSKPSCSPRANGISPDDHTGLRAWRGSDMMLPTDDRRQHQKTEAGQE